MGINLKNYQVLDKFNVSRETYHILGQFRDIVVEKNKKLNLIGKKTINNFEERHIVDCAQAIDFIDIKHNTCTDIGSGAGLPGIVLAIVLKGKNIQMKMNLFEKSYHKSSFLKEVSKELNLETEIIQKDVFKIKELNSGTIMARAFKPMPIVLDLVYKNFNKYKNLILFMGKSGKKTLTETLKDWDFEYKEKRSLTNDDSFLVSIKNIKKKN